MVGLPDIATLKRKVEIRGVPVECTGIGAEGLAILVDRFPAVAKALSEKSTAELNAQAVVKLAPKVVAAFIAAGIGCPGNEEEEKKAADLSLGEQMDLISMIFSMTFPRGVGPFVASMEALGLLSAINKSAPVSPGMDPGTKSPSPSKESSVKEDILQK